MDLLRRILIEVEEQPAGSSLEWYRSGPNPQPIEKLEHAKLLIDEDFLDGGITRGGDGYPAYIEIVRLTMKGHDFLEAARNPTIWDKMREAGKQKSLHLTMQVTQQLLTAYAEKKLGLKE